MNSYARGGLEILYESFEDAHNKTEIMQKQLEFFEEMGQSKDNYYSIEDDEGETSNYNFI